MAGVVRHHGQGRRRRALSERRRGQDAVRRAALPRTHRGAAHGKRLIGVASGFCCAIGGNRRGGEGGRNSTDEIARDVDMDIRASDQRYNPYRIFSREQWAALRNDTPMTLEPGEFSRLRSLHDRLDLKEVEEIYLPLSRLLSIHVDAAQRLYYAQRQFLGIRDRKVPY